MKIETRKRKCVEKAPIAGDMTRRFLIYDEDAVDANDIFEAQDIPKIGDLQPNVRPKRWRCFEVQVFEVCTFTWEVHCLYERFNESEANNAT